MVAEIEKLNYGSAYDEQRLLNIVKEIYDKRSKELGINSGAPIEHPLWFTPLVQDVVTTLWLEHKTGNNLRSAAVKYMKEEAAKHKEQLLMSTAIDLIHSVLPDENK